MGSMIYFTVDTHFIYLYSISFYGRPFKNMEQILILKLIIYKLQQGV